MREFRKFICQFGNINDEIISELKHCFTKSHLSKNQIFAREGVYAHQVAFLETGIVRSYIQSTNGKDYTKQFFVSPAMIGAYSSLITNLPNRIVQQALTDCIIWTANYKDIESLYSKYHAMERIGRKIAEYYYLEKEQHIIEMALHDATIRYSILQKRYPDIESSIQQKYVASYLSISQTQLSRIRKTRASV